MKAAKKRGPGGRPRLFDQIVAVRLPNKLLAQLDREVEMRRRRKPAKEPTRADVIRMCIQTTLGPKRGNRG